VFQSNFAAVMSTDAWIAGLGGGDACARFGGGVEPAGAGAARRRPERMR
jgi:hypothetical protein